MMVEAERSVILPPPLLRRIAPSEREAVPCTDVFADWYRSHSSLLLISGPPGAGKTTALEELKKVPNAISVKCEDDFPKPGQDLETISQWMATARNANTRLAIATKIRANDPRTGITQHLRSEWFAQEPWVTVIEPMSISTAVELSNEQDQEDTIREVLKLVMKLDREDHDTRFLRTPGALKILAETHRNSDSIKSISDVIEAFIDKRLFSSSSLPPLLHRRLMSRICLHHFLGQGDTAVTELDEDRVGDRMVSLQWMQDRVNSEPRSSNKPLPNAQTIAEDSPFLRFDFESPSTAGMARVVLPDTLSYEYFVARGILDVIEEHEPLGLSRNSLRDASDGFVVAFMQPRIRRESHYLDELESRCRDSNLNPHDRLFFLYLLEDRHSFVPLLSAEEYITWLEAFVDGEAPNSHCWKIAAYQLLVLGKLELSRFLDELNNENPDERSSEAEIQSQRGAGDIDQYLIERMRNPELHRCRGVTAVRMGHFGSLECVVPLGHAIADRTNSDYEDLSLPRFSGHLDCWLRPTEKGVQNGHAVSTRVPGAGNRAGAAA